MLIRYTALVTDFASTSGIDYNLLLTEELKAYLHILACAGIWLYWVFGHKGLPVRQHCLDL